MPTAGAGEMGELRGGADPPPPPLPTMAEITKFAVPALALWLTGPLLSLIDSSAGKPRGSLLCRIKVDSKPCGMFSNERNFLQILLNIVPTVILLF